MISNPFCNRFPLWKQEYTKISPFSGKQSPYPHGDFEDSVMKLRTYTGKFGERQHHISKVATMFP